MTPLPPVFNWLKSTQKDDGNSNAKRAFRQLFIDLIWFALEKLRLPSTDMILDNINK